MKFKFTFLCLILLLLASCKTEEEVKKSSTFRVGNYDLLWEEISCNYKIPEGKTFIKVENKIEDRFCKFIFDGAQYFEFSLDPKQEKEMVINAGNYNILFFTSAYGSDFRERQQFYLENEECYQLSVSLRKSYRDYETSPKR